MEAPLVSPRVGVIARAGRIFVIAVGVGLIVGVPAWRLTDRLFPSVPGVLDLRPGACIGVSTEGRIESLDCREPHDAQVVAVYATESGEVPSLEAKLDRLARCRAGLGAHLRPGVAESLLVRVLGERSGRGESGNLLCVLQPRAGGSVTGSLLR